MVAATVQGDAKQPCGKARFALPSKILQATVGAHKGVLAGLAGILTPGQKLPAEVKYFFLMHLDQLAVGIVILHLRCCHQLLLAVDKDLSVLLFLHPMRMGRCRRIMDRESVSGNFEIKGEALAGEGGCHGSTGAGVLPDRNRDAVP